MVDDDPLFPLFCAFEHAIERSGSDKERNSLRAVQAKLEGPFADDFERFKVVITDCQDAATKIARNSESNRELQSAVDTAVRDLRPEPGPDSAFAKFQSLVGSGGGSGGLGPTGSSAVTPGFLKVEP